MSKELLRLSSPENPAVAIVAGRCGDYPGTHTGILYVHDGQVLISHQRWSYIFGNEIFHDCETDIFKDGYAYSIPDLEPEQSERIVLWCRLIARRYIGEPLIGVGRGRSNSFPMAFKHAALTFSPDSPNAGELMLTKDGRGLTCSLFVVAVFASAGIQLVKFETWERRDGDDQRHDYLLNELKKYCPQFITHEEIAEIASQLPCVRLRPEEAVAACVQSQPDAPASFVPTALAGEWIMKTLDTMPIGSCHLGIFLRAN